MATWPGWSSPWVGLLKSIFDVQLFSHISFVDTKPEGLLSVPASIRPMSVCPSVPWHPPDHGSITTKFVTPTAPSCIIYTRWSSRRYELECDAPMIYTRWSSRRYELGCDAPMIYTRWSSRRYELGCDAPMIYTRWSSRRYELGCDAPMIYTRWSSRRYELGCDAPMLLTYCTGA